MTKTTRLAAIGYSGSRLLLVGTGVRERWPVVEKEVFSCLPGGGAVRKYGQ
jgi:hypothetical protein